MGGLALGETRDPAALAPLLAALGDEDGPTNMAINALGDLGDARAVDPLLARLDPSDPYRATAALALTKFDDPRAAAVLAGQLAAPASVPGLADATHRHVTATLLSQYGPRGLDLLAAAAGHPSPAVRAAVVHGLYHGLSVADHPAAADALRGLASDPDPAVREGAAQCLAILKPRLGRRAAKA